MNFLDTAMNYLEDLQMRCMYAGTLFPFYKYTVKRNFRHNKLKDVSIVEDIMRESIKRSKEITNFVIVLCRNVEKALYFE